MNHHFQVIDIFQKHFMATPFCGIEIGTAEGLLTKSLLLYFPNLTHIYGVDPYVSNYERGFEMARPQEWHDDRYSQAKVALAVYEGRYTLIKDFSDNAVSLTPDIVDFVWIDGDHNSDQVIKDIKNYYPKVRKGGIFGGHDYPLALRYIKDLTQEIVMVGDDLTWWLVKE